MKDLVGVAQVCRKRKREVTIQSGSSGAFLTFPPRFAGQAKPTPYGRGRLAWYGSGTYELGGLKGGQNLTLPDAPSSYWNTMVALAVGRNDQSTTYSGILSGSGIIAKLGYGTLTLSGQNIHTGATAVASGTLKLDNAYALQNSTLSFASVSFTDFDGTPRSYSGGTLSFGALTK
jgi:autotransporter-associated beta strand protein